MKRSLNADQPDIPSLTQDIFDQFHSSKWEAVQNKLVLKRYQRMARFMRERLGKRRKILDLGCGVGQNTVLLSQLDYDCQGIEITLQDIWSQLPQSFMVFDGQNLPYQSESFDAVVMFGVLEHVGPDSKSDHPTDMVVCQTARSRLLAQVHRILKPQGQLFVWNFPNPYSPIELLNSIAAVPVRHKGSELQTLESITTLAQANGLEVLEKGRTGVLPVSLGHTSRTLMNILNSGADILGPVDEVVDMLCGNLLGQSNYFLAQKVSLEEI